MGGDFPPGRIRGEERHSRRSSLCADVHVGTHSEKSEVGYRRTAADLQNAKMLRVLSAHHGWSVRFFDVSTALVLTPVEDAVLAVPPEDCQGPTHGGV